SHRRLVRVARKGISGSDSQDEASMVWHPDLSVWGARAAETTSPFRAVGWLERGHDYPTGPADAAFFQRLVELLQDPWEPAVSLGFHRCDLCQFPSHAHTGKRNLYVPRDG